MKAAPSVASTRVALEQHLDQLAHAVDATSRSTGFRAALEVMARFWRYSPMNQWLISRICPHATRVAGARTWQRLGRSVRAGESAIYILAPSSPTGGPFLAVPVFDVSQTAGRELPKLELALEGDDAPIERIERAAEHLGIRVVERDPRGRELGVTAMGASLGGRIEIARGLGRPERMATLVHELAHELLHQGEQARRRGPERTHAEEETEAEATSFVIMRAFGLASTAPTYIAWQGGSGAQVRRSMARVYLAAKTILDASVRSSLRPRPRRRKGETHGLLQEVASRSRSRGATARGTRAREVCPSRVTE
jgi:hypothetical protein